MQHPATDRSENELLTLPALNREYRIGMKSLYRLAAEGAFPVYTAGTSRPRVRRAEFERWLKSTRLRPPEREEKHQGCNG